MRIAFTGASGTGKTTLAKRLAEFLKLPFCPIGSRSVAASMGFVGPDGQGRPYDVDRADGAAYLTSLKRAGVPVPQQGFVDTELLLKLPVEVTRAAAIDALRCGGTTTSVRLLFQRTLQTAKITWELEHSKGFVTDRTSIDDMAYLAVSPHGMAGIDAAYVDRAVNHTRDYSFVFFAPIAAFQHIGDDPARIQNAGYHAIHEMLIVGGLRASVRPELLCKLPAGSLEERWQFLLNCVL